MFGILFKIPENNHNTLKRHSFYAIVLVIIMAFSSSALFIPKQTLWVDEVTQMSGLTLNPIEVANWLAGENRSRFGVPPDRMPPLSYWLGWSWSKLFGLTEISLRWFGTLINLLSVGIVFIIIYRQWGLQSATLLGLAFGLSPNIVISSVEIRAYPLFLLFSCGSFFFFIEILKQPKKYANWHVGGLVACLILAMYTHFYGVVLSAVLLSVLLFIIWQVNGKLTSLILASSITGIATVGLIPFILVSVSGSHAIAEGTRIYWQSTLKLVYRLIGHPTMSMSWVFIAIAFISVMILLILSIKLKEKNDQVSVGLWLSLLLGIIVVNIANFIVVKFGPTNPNYNLWMVPNLYLILACGLGIANKEYYLDKLAIIAVILLIVANGYSMSQLILHGEYFSHGPHRQISSVIRQIGTEKVSIVYEKSNRNWGMVYFPLYYEFNQSLPQYLSQPHAQDDIVVQKLPQGTSRIDPTMFTTPYVIVIQVGSQNTQQIKRQIRSGNSSIVEGMISSTFRRSERWQLVSRETFPGFTRANIVIFKQRGT